MNLKDTKRRWTKVTSPEINTGHSVCNSCGKDMPGCWDVVCKGCNRTFCYDCVAHRDRKYWYCKKCYTEIFELLKNILPLWGIRMWNNADFGSGSISNK